MKIGFIGAGKVGTSFGIYLKNQGFEIYGYFSKTFSSAEKSAKLTGSKAVLDETDLVKSTDILFITTSDDAITKVCDDLVERNVLSEGKILVHMSGASSSNILKRAKKSGCFIYSMHPLQAFADIEKAVDDLKGTYFSIEGDKEKLHVLEDMLKKLGNPYFKLTAEQKSIYHVTACVVSNYLVTLMDYGLYLFDTIGIDKREGYKALLPLIEGTIKNINGLGTKDALTGPIVRGDVGTVKKHIEELKNLEHLGTVKQNIGVLDFYKIMGVKTLELAKKKDENKDFEELKNILKEVE
ncbi:Rossmann-like and DUF2520 domain-containing protein [Crassaminicella profunda]|uniref:Rossmann-like and DUF2520 domain-containing protein n=1 Tax=Crassaminicella profunda TaxID=1286698 RepID=UPI001CA6A5B5|nr:DUF2520 domain-containing protein [Crassaminicella profunda]QZY54870.1 DUF2520 domain-containing protein [Crassaminicella profunda]